jgi:hypothetical protein
MDSAKFLEKYKSKISIMSKQGPIGVVMSSKKPIDKKSLLQSRNVALGVKHTLNFSDKKPLQSRNLKRFLSKLKPTDKSKYEEFQNNHKLVDYTDNKGEPVSSNSNITKTTDQSSSN